MFKEDCRFSAGVRTIYSRTIETRSSVVQSHTSESTLPRQDNPCLFFDFQDLLKHQHARSVPTPKFCVTRNGDL